MGIISFLRFNYENGGYAETTGAFKTWEKQSDVYKLKFNDYSAKIGVDVDFVATRSSPIYGASDLVQPRSLRVLFAVKAF